MAYMVHMAYMAKVARTIRLKPVLGSLALAIAAIGCTSGADWTQPMTSWGEPDISGMWPINHLIGVPLQRDPKYGDRLHMTDEEFAEAQASVEARDSRFQGGPIPVADAAGQALTQTSLIVDPVDGRFPELTPYGKELQADMRDSYRPGQTVFDSVADFSPWDRCITRGMPVSMLPRNYNNGIRIMQSPGYVVIIVEMAHEARVIPTTPTPPIDDAIEEWMGESRGHWEGNTLVVETTNFNGLVGKTSGGVPGAPRELQPSTPQMRITERFTRTGPDSMDFEMLVDDPQVLATGSYTVAYPMLLDNEYEMYEYACHEGNTAVRNYIETSRFERAQ
ncbi:MAG TPA: hypothetical protein VNR18_06205 [Hyphomicrobiales bacterium]|nr:hypothetical protein [Hyphomicrobiales bacterium]